MTPLEWALIPFDWGPHKNRIFGHTKGDTRDICTWRRDPVRTQQENSYPEAKERGVIRSQT